MVKWQWSLLVVLLSSAIGWADYYATGFETNDGFINGQTIIGTDGWSRMNYGSDSQSLVATTSAAVTQGSQALAINVVTELKDYHAINPNAAGVAQAVSETFQVSVDIGWDTSIFTRGAVAVFNSNSEWGGIWFGISNDNGTMKFQYRDGATWTSLTLEPGQMNPAMGTMYHCVATIHPVTCSYDLNIYTLSGGLVGRVEGAAGRYTWETSFNSIGFQVAGASGKFYVDNLKIGPVATSDVKSSYDNVDDESLLEQCAQAGINTKLWTVAISPKMTLGLDGNGKVIVVNDMSATDKAYFENYAQLAQQNGINLYLVVGFHDANLTQLENLGTYAHAMVEGPTRYLTPGEKPAPGPLEERYWLGPLLTEARFAAELSKEYPNVKGFLVDVEMYAGDMMWRWNSSFDNQTFQLVTDEMEQRGEIDESLDPDSVPTDNRYVWLKDNNLLEAYFAVQEDLVADVASRFRAAVDQINPDLELGFLPFDANWFYRGWARGLGTKTRPVWIFSESEYSGWSPATLARMAWLKVRGISCRYVTGLLLGNFTPDQLALQASRSLDTTDGYWLFTTYSLWESEPNPSWVPYELKASENQYWSALATLNNTTSTMSNEEKYDQYICPGSNLLTNNRHYLGPKCEIPVTVTYSTSPNVPLYDDPNMTKLFDGGEYDAHGTVAWFAQVGQAVEIKVDLDRTFLLEQVYLSAGHYLESLPAITSGTIEVSSSLDDLKYYPLGSRTIYSGEELAPGNLDFHNLGVNARYLKIKFNASVVPTNGVWALSELAVWGKDVDYYSTGFEADDGYISGQTIIGMNGWARMNYGLDSQALATTAANAVTQGSQALAINVVTELKGYHAINPNVFSVAQKVAGTFQVSVDIGWDISVFTSGVVYIFNSGSEWGGIQFGLVNDNGTMKFQYRDGATWCMLPLQSGQTNPAMGSMYHCVTLIHPSSSSYDLNVYTMSGDLVGSVKDVQGRFTSEISYDSIGFYVKGSSGKLYVDNLQIGPESVRILDISAASGTMTIDGVLTEWSDADWVKIDKDYDGDPSDILQAFYAVKWSPTTNKIYVAIKVEDTAHYFTNDYNGWANRDAVEIYLRSRSIESLYDYYHAEQDLAQQWVVGIKSGSNDRIWMSLSDTNNVPVSSGFVAAGKVDGNWIYYEAELTPFESFGGLINQSNVISTLESNQQIGLDVCVVSNNGSTAQGPYGIVGYTGMKCENLMAGKYDDWTQFRLHTLRVDSQATVSVIPGDANRDGMVDVGDLGILAANYGITTGATWSMGDFNNDDAVDVGDLGILAASYGTGTSGTDFDADYAKVFGITSESDNNSEEIDSVMDETNNSSLCSNLGLPLIASLAMMSFLIVKLEE